MLRMTGRGPCTFKFVEGKISHEEQEMLIQKDIKEDDMWLPW